ncbi:hypothetical protein [Rhodocista pekingensis]|uniref:Uncharacterized protein n=1 Tax=Rhodocista pekingensis TaxID=201185 RepID=A0ABW2KZQ5_9PROT
MPSVAVILAASFLGTYLALAVMVRLASLFADRTGWRRRAVSPLGDGGMVVAAAMLVGVVTLG